MSTRGAFGFRINGVDKVTYNHSGSYPSWLGRQMVDYVQKDLLFRNREEVKAAAERITMVDDARPPKPQDVARWSNYYNSDVNGGTLGDWYALTREAQGYPGVYLDMGDMPDGYKFLGESLWCEYAYIINLDDWTLECYEGFQKTPHTMGRYGTSAFGLNDGFYGVALKTTFPLDAIPENWADVAYPQEEAA